MVVSLGVPLRDRVCQVHPAIMAFMSMACPRSVQLIVVSVQISSLYLQKLADTLRKSTGSEI